MLHDISLLSSTSSTLFAASSVLQHKTYYSHTFQHHNTTKTLNGQIICHPLKKNRISAFWHHGKHRRCKYSYSMRYGTKTWVLRKVVDFGCQQLKALWNILRG